MLVTVIAVGCSQSGSPQGEVKTFGPPIPADAAYVEIPELVKNAKKYAEKDIFLQGKATNQCPTSGCWIDVVGLEDKSGASVVVRLTSPAFQDRMDEIKGKLVGKKVKLKGYVSVREDKAEVYASSLEVLD